MIAKQFLIELKYAKKSNLTHHEQKTNMQNVSLFYTFNIQICIDMYIEPYAYLSTEIVLFTPTYQTLS